MFNDELNELFKAMITLKRLNTEVALESIFNITIKPYLDYENPYGYDEFIRMKTIPELKKEKNILLAKSDKYTKDMINYLYNSYIKDMEDTKKTKQIRN